jgi:valyl-tRNA synthetase
VLKVTPAHDKADWEIYQRYCERAFASKRPELILMKVPDTIMHPDATMNGLAGQALDGLDRFKARQVAVEQLKELGALDKEAPYKNNVGFSERADVPIEPRLSEQWFLKYPGVGQSRRCVQVEGEPILRREREVTMVCAAGGKSLEAHLPQEKLDTQPAPSARVTAGELLQDVNTLGSPKMRFFPQRWAKVYDHWMANIQDWCISRQLWWGHRIPVWTGRIDVRQAHPAIQDAFYREQNEHSLSGAQGHRTVIRCDGAEDNCLVHAATESEAEARIIAGWSFTQDPDVLDTWFSSWLWPFATMGWTGDREQDAQNSTLKTFYPTADLVTAPEIIFFWVARMIMAGYEFMGEIPFRNVYFTGIIRDKQGRKMSKSLGNSPDPLDLIAKYGADAVRFGTMRSAPLGQDVLFDEKDVELGRNFCNKLWNACRFRQMVGSADFPVEGEIDPALLTSDDKWILLRLDQAIREIDAAFAGYRFNEVAQTLYRFFWGEYCDWYIEASKATLSGGSRVDEALTGASEIRSPKSEIDPSLLTSAATDTERRRTNTLAVIDFVLSHTLRLFHPFLPFITEELWHGMGYHEDLPADQGGQTIMVAHWPKPFDAAFKEHFGLDESDERFVNSKYELVGQGRNLRREANISAGKRVRFVLKPAGRLAAHEVDVLKILLQAEALEVDPNYQPHKGTLAVDSELGELYLPLEGLVDFAAERARLTKELVKMDAEIEKVQAKLNNPAFREKVPPAILEEHQKRLADWQAKRAHARQALDALGECPVRQKPQTE